MRRSLALPLYGASAVLLLLVVLEWLPGRSAPVVHAPVPTRATAATPAGAEEKDVGEWADTVLERPLFTIGRRPGKSAGKTQLVSSTGLPRLAGIMITPFGRRAIFMPDGGKPLVLAEGAALGEDKINEIKPDRVLVSGPKGDMVLLPAYDHHPGVPTPPVFQPPTPPFQPNLPTAGPPPGMVPGQPNFAFPNGRPQIPFPPPGTPTPPPSDNSNDDDDSGDQAQPVAPMPALPAVRPGIPRERQ